MENNSSIEFIDISFDDRIKWLKYLEKENLKGIQLISKSQKETSRTLNFAGIPMHFIVDPEGNYKEYKSFEVTKNVIEKTNR